jgi:hypothetical protein
MNEYFEPLSICVQKLCDARKSQSKYLDRLSENDRKFIIDKLYVFDSEKILNNKDLLYNPEYIKNKSLFQSKILDIILERNTFIIEAFEQVLGIK